MALLRTATTLGFVKIRSYIIGVLKSRWPDLVPVYLHPAPGAMQNTEPSLQSVRHALDTIILAKECDVPEVLRSACYQAVCSSSLLAEALDALLAEDVSLSPRCILTLFQANNRLASLWQKITADPPLYGRTVCAAV